jgi:hypothetical protein
LISAYIYGHRNDLHALRQLSHLHLLRHPLLHPFNLLAITLLALGDINDEEYACDVSELLLGHQPMQVLAGSVEGRVVELGGQEGRGGGAEDKDQGGEPEGAKEGREEQGGL